MNSIQKLIDLFVIADSEDISADVNFRMSFSNVVNLLLFTYSLMMGIYALFIELRPIALFNMFFSVIFLLYIIFSFLTPHFYRYRSVIYIDNALIFIYFLVAFYFGAQFGFAGMVTIIYPFIGIVLYGRKLGLLMSFAQLLILTVYVLMVQVWDFQIGEVNFRPQELIVMAILQLDSILVFYVVIYWLSTMLYDKIRETTMLTDELKVKSDIVKTLISQIRTKSEQVNGLVQRIQIETHLNDAQKVMVAEIYGGTQDIVHTIDSIDLASKNNIKPVRFEERKFDINALIGSLLQKYNRRPSVHERHTVTISTEIPAQIVGNSQLTRSVLNEIFESIDKTVDMDNQPLNVNVALGELTEETETLVFEISLAVDILFDNRELGTEETMLREQFDLANIDRVVHAYGGEFDISYEDKQLIIEFTQQFKNVERLGGITEKDSVQAQRSMQKANAVVSVSKAAVLIVDNNIVNQHILTSFIDGKVGRISVASSGKEAITKFENGKYDVVIVELQMPDMNGFNLARSIRDIESGFGGHVPIIAVSSTIMYSDIRQRCYDAGMDGFLPRPFLAADIMNVMVEKLKS